MRVPSPPRMMQRRWLWSSWTKSIIQWRDLCLRYPSLHCCQSGVSCFLITVCNVWTEYQTHQTCRFLHSTFYICMVIMVINCLWFCCYSSDTLLSHVEQLLRAFILKISVCDAVLNNNPPGNTHCCTLHTHTTLCLCLFLFISRPYGK